MASPNMYAKHEEVFSPLTSPVQPPKPGSWDGTPRGVKAFLLLKPPQMCVHNDHCDEGIFWRYTYSGPQVPGSPLFSGSRAVKCTCAAFVSHGAACGLPV